MFSTDRNRTCFVYRWIEFEKTRKAHTLPGLSGLAVAVGAEESWGVCFAGYKRQIWSRWRALLPDRSQLERALAGRTRAHKMKARFEQSWPEAR